MHHKFKLLLKICKRKIYIYIHDHIANINFHIHSVHMEVY